MNDLDYWFEKTSKHANRTPSLYASLVTNRVFTYLGYRLRFSILLTTVRFVVHAVEFFVLFSSLGGMATSIVMVLRIGGVLVSGAWWGLLDVMRERLRVFARAGEREAAEREIGRWLMLSALLAVALTVGAGVALALAFPVQNSWVAQLYGFLIIVEIAIGFPVRVLHSGIFATRRVYRPGWSLFAPLIVQLLVLGGGFYFYPAAAIIVAIVTSNALGIWISIHYSTEVYRLTGLRPRFCTPTLAFWPLAFWRCLPAIPFRTGLSTTLSATGLRLDGVFVLGIVGVYGTDERSFDLTAAVSSWSHVDTFQFFYLVLPLLRGAFGAADVYYFDFVRLRDTPVLREFQLVFFQKMLWLIPLVATYYWLLATILGTVVLRDVPMTFLVALLPLFVVRALIGTYEIRLFAEGRAAVHIAAMVFLALMLWLVWISPNPASDLIEIIAAMTTELIVLINVQHQQDRRELALPPLLALGDWLRAIIREQGAVAVGSVVIPEYSTPKQKMAAIGVLQCHLDTSGHFAYLSATKVIYYQRISRDAGTASLHVLLPALTGGITARGQSLQKASATGQEAVDLLIARKWIQPEPAESSLATPESLIRSFNELFPDGVAVDVETTMGTSELRDWDRQLLAETLPAALRCLESGLVMVPAAGRWVTPIYFGGSLRLLCFLPPDPDGEQVKAWRTSVRAWQLSAVESGVPVGVPR